MRVVLFTGKGGVGKTTAAAGTAALAARRGLKTLVLSTDAAHSLSDAFGAPAGQTPSEISPGLFVQQVDPQQRFEQSWHAIRGYLLGVLDAVGVDSLAAEELIVLPGAAEVLALLEVRDQVRTGDWDLVVVDCAPTAETIRMLALPELLGWYLERVFPRERRIARSLRPVLGRVAGMPLPDDEVLDGVTRLHAELAEVRDLLTDPGTSVRLVLTPESVVIAEARRTLTSLSLFGYRVDSVLVNRVFPDADADPWRAGWVAAQAEQLAEIESSFAPLPVYRSNYQPAEPVGEALLADLAEAAYGSADPFAAAPHEPPLTVERSGDEYVLSFQLPLADRSEVGLVRTGDELVLTVGSYRRVVALPSGLRRCTVVGASLRGGALRIRFEPDPSLWMGL